MKIIKVKEKSNILKGRMMMAKESINEVRGRRSWMDLFYRMYETYPRDLSTMRNLENIWSIKTIPPESVLIQFEKLAQQLHKQLKSE